MCSIYLFRFGVKLSCFTRQSELYSSKCCCSGEA